LVQVKAYEYVNQEVSVQWAFILCHALFHRNGTSESLSFSTETYFRGAMIHPEFPTIIQQSRLLGLFAVLIEDEDEHQLYLPQYSC
jgi:hypothetical protein